MVQVHRTQPLLEAVVQGRRTRPLLEAVVQERNRNTRHLEAEEPGMQELARILLQYKLVGAQVPGQRSLLAQA